jgi:hypothetical protein
MIKRRRLIHAAQFAVMFVTLSVFGWAQWPDYPTRGVPQTKEGKPDLSGPVPRTSDGKPDLTGLWEARGGGGGQRGAAVPAPPNAPPNAQPEVLPNPNGGPPLATFFNVGAGFEEGLPFTGWTRNSLKLGDVVTVTGWRAKNAPYVANAGTVTLADGKKVFAGSSIDTTP